MQAHLQSCSDPQTKSEPQCTHERISLLVRGSRLDPVRRAKPTPEDVANDGSTDFLEGGPALVNRVENDGSRSVEYCGGEGQQLGQCRAVKESRTPSERKGNPSSEARLAVDVTREEEREWYEEYQNDEEKDGGPDGQLERFLELHQEIGRASCRERVS